MRLQSDVCAKLEFGKSRFSLKHDVLPKTQLRPRRESFSKNKTLLSSSEGNGEARVYKGSLNKEAGADSGIYRVREAAVAAVHNCIVYSGLYRVREATIIAVPTPQEGMQCSNPFCTLGYALWVLRCV